MKNAQGNFDFTSTIEAIRPWMESSHPDFTELDRNNDDFLSARSKFSKALFSEIPEYLERFFDMNGAAEGVSLMDMVPQKPEDVLVTQMGFPSAEQKVSEITDGTWRFFEDFLLTEEETAQSIEYLQSNEQFCLTFCLLGAAVHSYFQEFLDAVNWTEEDGFTQCYGESSQSHTQLNKIREQIVSAEQFVKELLPVFAFGFIDGKEVTERNLALGLCDTFRNKAMQGHEDYYGRTNPIHCAFGPALGALSSIVIEECENGNMSVSNEQRPGALFYFLYQKAGQILAEQKASLELASQQMAVDHS